MLPLTGWCCRATAEAADNGDITEGGWAASTTEGCFWTGSLECEAEAGFWWRVGMACWKPPWELWFLMAFILKAKVHHSILTGHCDFYSSIVDPFLYSFWVCVLFQVMAISDASSAQIIFCNSYTNAWPSPFTFRRCSISVIFSFFLI